MININNWCNKFRSSLQDLTVLMDTSAFMILNENLVMWVGRTNLVT